MQCPDEWGTEKVQFSNNYCCQGVGKKGITEAILEINLKPNRSLPSEENIPGKRNSTCTKVLHPVNTYLACAYQCQELQTTFSTYWKCIIHSTLQMILLGLQQQQKKGSGNTVERRVRSENLVCHIKRHVFWSASMKSHGRLLSKW